MAVHTRIDARSPKNNSFDIVKDGVVICSIRAQSIKSTETSVEKMRHSVNLAVELSPGTELHKQNGVVII